jgi:hypothetical protein
MGGAVPLRARLHRPPFKPCVRFSRTRLTDGVHVSSMHGFGYGRGLTPRTERHPVEPVMQRVEPASRDTAWLPHTASAGVIELCREALASRGVWVRQSEPCPRSYLQEKRHQSRSPSLRRRSPAPPSPVLWPPRTPAAHRATSPSAYTPGPCPTPAAQTGLSCSAANWCARATPLTPASPDAPFGGPRVGPGLHRDVLARRSHCNSEAAGFTYCCGPHACSHHRGFRRPARATASRRTDGACYRAHRTLTRTGLAPASSLQHEATAVDSSGRTMPPNIAKRASAAARRHAGARRLRNRRVPHNRTWAKPTATSGRYPSPKKNSKDRTVDSCRAQAQRT